MLMSLPAMNFKLLKHHSKLIVINLALILLTLFIVSATSTPKAFSEVEMVDVIGEGGTALMALIWIFFVLISRPAGRVTNFLVMGLGCLHMSLLMDLLDEFFRYNAEFAWLATYEPVPAPIGMLILTYGLYHWHIEQLSLNRQLLRRERVYREHGLIDYITGLYSAEYMTQQIDAELEQMQQPDSPLAKQAFSLLMLDIDAFDEFVQRHGDTEGDRFLRELSELILMNIRVTDLACRYAGDRFIVIFPQTTLNDAAQIADQLQQSIAHLAFKPQHSAQAVFKQVSISLCASHANSSTQELLNKLNQQMENAKRHKQASLAAENRLAW